MDEEDLSMKLCCPACGSVFSLDVLLASESARGAVMSALELPAPLGKLLIQYIALFRPAQRQLSFDRVARLLEELRQPISDAKIERNGRLWPAPLDTWRAAITEMLALRDAQKLRLPLASHGYLFEIIASQADKAQASAERAHEARLRGETPVGGIAAKPVAAQAPQIVRPVIVKGAPMPSSFKDAVAALGLGNLKGGRDADDTE